MLLTPFQRKRLQNLLACFNLDWALPDRVPMLPGPPPRRYSGFPLVLLNRTCCLLSPSAASFLFTLSFWRSSASSSFSEKGVWEVNFCYLPCLKYFYSILIFDCLGIEFWIGNNFPLKFWGHPPWWSDSSLLLRIQPALAITGFLWRLSPPTPGARVPALLVPWKPMARPLWVASHHSCLTGPFKLETYLLQFWENVLTSYLIIFITSYSLFFLSEFLLFRYLLSVLFFLGGEGPWIFSSNKFLSVYCFFCVHICYLCV